MDDINSTVKSILQSASGSMLSSDYNAALEQLKKGEVLDRDNPEILYNLGLAYTRLELYKTALEYFQRVLLLETQFIDLKHVKKNIAFCLIHLEQYVEALKYLESILSDSPSDIMALNMKGFSLEKTGKINESLRTYSEVFKYDKSDLNSMNSTAYLMAKQGIDIKKALQIAEYVHRHDRNNPAYRDTLGYIYLKFGNVEKAKKHLSEAYKKLPFNIEITEHINELKILKKI